MRRHAFQQALVVDVLDRFPAVLATGKADRGVPAHQDLGDTIARALLENGLDAPIVSINLPFGMPPIVGKSLDVEKLRATELLAVGRKPLVVLVVPVEEMNLELPFVALLSLADNPAGKSVTLPSYP